MNKKFTLFLKPIILIIMALMVESGIAQPTISSFAPTSGSVGTLVTITGANFNTTPSGNIVYFGGIRAVVIASTATTITTAVPMGATYQPISVTNNNLTGYSAKPFVITFFGGTGLNIGSFGNETHLDSVTGIETKDLKYGDFDNDGRNDLAVVDRLNNTLSIYKNTYTANTISFASKIDYPTGSSPFNLNIGDIDGDGKLDIVVSNQNSNTISIYKNNSTTGAISFNSKVDFATATQPGAIALADFDNDGKTDIATNCIDLAGTISVFRNISNAGTISFAAKNDIVVGGTLNNIASGDLDGDYKADIVVTNFATNQILMLKNSSTIGSISFTAGLTIASPNFPRSLVLADFDGDGKLDIATASNNGFSGTIWVYRNKTTSSFSFSILSFNSANNSNTSDLAAADLDGDGDPDLAAINYGQSISLLTNSSIPGVLYFGNRVDIQASIIDAKLAIADLSGDGKPDISVLQGYYRVVVLENRCALPYISYFSPASGSTGTTVTISGYNFTGSTSVSFGGIPAASFNVVDAFTITAVVGAGASGNVSVTNQFGTAAWRGFTYYFSPVISSFTPVSAAKGETITITGSNLGSATGVSIGGIPATSFTVVSPTTITAIVGAGASGNIAVTTPGGTATLSGFTFIPPPVISSFTPTSGSINQIISITGNNFSGATEVKFGGIPAATFTVNSITNITATIREGSSGNITVKTPGGTAVAAGFTYIVPPSPVITSFFPTSGNAGTWVTITGLNFSPIAGNNTVYFGAVKAVILSATGTTLTVAVPNGTTYEPISLTTNYHTAYSTKPFIVTFPGGTIAANSFEGPIFIPNSNLPVDIAIADYDNDGKPDIATSSNGDYQLAVLRNIGSGGNISFAPKIDFPYFGNGDAISNADIDGDGKIDVIETVDTGLVYVYRNLSTPGTINFSLDAGATVHAGYGSSLACGDIDGDGKTDVIVGSNYTINLLKNTSVVGNISFAPRMDISSIGTSVGPGGIAINDVDGDNKPDIVFVKYDSVFVMLNTTTGGIISFAPTVSYANKVNNVNSIALEVSIGDLDGDNKPDIVVSNWLASNSISIFKNTCTIGVNSFAALTDYLMGYHPSYMSITDLDGDGKPDIAVSNGDGNVPRTISAIKNTCTPGNILFANHLEYTDNDNSIIVGLEIADLNGDNMPEIVTSTNSRTVNNVANLLIFKNRTNYFLPLVLTKFNAACTNVGVSINWSTASEINTDHFEIEKNSNGTNWNNIGLIKSAGNSSLPKEYQFVDAESGTAIYRLKQVDRDGKFTYSTSVRSNCRTSQQPLQLYPIPAKNILNVRFPVSKNGKVTIQLTDPLGRIQIQKIVSVMKGSNNFELMVGSLPSGNYSIKVNGEDFLINGKIILQK